MFNLGTLADASQMKARPQVLDILFPKVRTEILRLLFLNAKEQRYVRELMIMSGLLFVPFRSN